MTELLPVDVGALPWLPSAGATSRVVYHYHDRPLIGIVETPDGTPYLYHCAYGHIEPVSVWVYTVLVPEFIDILDVAEGEEFDKFVYWLPTRGKSTFALAFEDRVIASTTGHIAEDGQGVREIIDQLFVLAGEQAEREAAVLKKARPDLLLAV